MANPEISGSRGGGLRRTARALGRLVGGAVEWFGRSLFSPDLRQYDQPAPQSAVQLGADWPPPRLTTDEDHVVASLLKRLRDVPEVPDRTDLPHIAAIPDRGDPYTRHPQ